jgi:hypothetical protein
MAELAGIDGVERPAVTAGEEEQCGKCGGASFEASRREAPQDEGFS